jgi:hypothetical protein
MPEITALPDLGTPAEGTDSLIAHDSSAAEESKIVEIPLSKVAAETLSGTAVFINTYEIVTKTNAAATYTVGTTDPLESYGGIIYATGACTITLEAVVAGMSVTVITVGDIAVSVKAGTNDLIVLDGTALDDADKATNLSATGDIIVLTYYSADGWYATSNSWTDGGA